MRDDDRRGVRVSRLHVDEMDVEAVDVRDEVRIAEDSSFNLPPVMLICPIVSELPDRRELHALRGVIDQLAAGPSCCVDAPLEVRKIFIRGAEAEWLNGVGGAT